MQDRLVLALHEYQRDPSLPMRLNLIVCGGRDFTDKALLRETLDDLAQTWRLFIITGGARGADTLAEQWREEHGHPGLVIKADWATHGRAAGPLRNAEMLRYAKDLAHGTPALLAFPGGRGTAHMTSLAKAAGIQTFKPRTPHEKAD